MLRELRALRRTNHMLVVTGDARHTTHHGNMPGRFHIGRMR
jgi:hypothetical protein